MQTSSSPAFSSVEAFRFGWRCVRRDFTPLAVLGALSVLLTFAQQASSAPHGSDARPLFPCSVASCRPR